MKTIYIDVLFVVNLTVNYILLIATGIFLGNRPHRAFWGAVIGGIYAIIVAIFPFTGGMVGKIVSALIMIIIAFGYREKILIRTITFFFISCVFAGMVMAIYMAFGKTMEIRGAYYINVPLKVLILAIVIAYILTSTIFKKRAKHSVLRHIEEVEIKLGDSSKKFNMLVDSGNDLSDPVSGKNIVIIDRKCIVEIMPRSLLKWILKLDTLTAPDIMKNIKEENTDISFYLVPYRALGVEHSLILCFKADKILRSGKEYNGLIGISPTSISGNGYEGIIGV